MSIHIKCIFISVPEGERVKRRLLRDRTHCQRFHIYMHGVDQFSSMIEKLVKCNKFLCFCQTFQKEERVVYFYY